MDRELINALSKKLADEGKLIEAGFVGYMLEFLPPGATDAQKNTLRVAFMLGAQHLFASILTVLDAGAEPTEADLHRMALIDKELREFMQKTAH